MVRFATKFT